MAHPGSEQEAVWVLEPEPTPAVKHPPSPILEFHTRGLPVARLDHGRLTLHCRLIFQIETFITNKDF